MAPTRTRRTRSRGGRRWHLAVALVAIAAAGCRSAGTPAPGAASARAERVPASLQAFVASVEMLPVRFGLREPLLARSLHELASAVPDLSTDRDVRLGAGRLSLLADRIPSATSPRAATDAADAAVGEAVGVLRGVARTEKARAQLARAQSTLRDLDRSMLLPAQSTRLRAVLADVGNGLLISLGVDPVLPEAPDTGSTASGETPEPARGAAPLPAPPAPPTAIGSATTEAARASELVARLSGATGPDARAAAADALDAFVRTLDALGVHGDALARVRSVVGFQARRLRASGSAFESAAWARTALVATVEALPASPTRAAGGAQGFAERAGTAARSISRDAWFPFQRARLQEAFRCVADALLAAADAGPGAARAHDGSHGVERSARAGPPPRP